MGNINPPFLGSLATLKDDKWLPLRLNSFLQENLPIFKRIQIPGKRISVCNDKTYIKICVTSKDSDQPVHPFSMTRILLYPSLDSLEAVEL